MSSSPPLMTSRTSVSFLRNMRSASMMEASSLSRFTRVRVVHWDWHSSNSPRRRCSFARVSIAGSKVSEAWCTRATRSTWEGVNEGGGFSCRCAPLLPHLQGFLAIRNGFLFLFRPQGVVGLSQFVANLGCLYPLFPHLICSRRQSAGPMLNCRDPVRKGEHESTRTWLNASQLRNDAVLNGQRSS